MQKKKYTNSIKIVTGKMRSGIIIIIIRNEYPAIYLRTGELPSSAAGVGIARTGMCAWVSVFGESNFCFSKNFGSRWLFDSPVCGPPPLIFPSSSSYIVCVFRWLLSFHIKTKNSSAAVSYFIFFLLDVVNGELLDQVCGGGASSFLHFS